MTINEMVEQAHENAKSKGWWNSQRLHGGTLCPNEVEETIPEKLALIHAEVSEALEDYREDKLQGSVDVTGQPVGLPSELADILIRVADLAGALRIDLEAEVKAKIAYNATRPHRHGGKRC